MPFVQGQLRKEPVSIAFATRCACCEQPMSLEIDDRLAYRVADEAKPLVFVPLVNFAKLTEPSIIDAF